MSKIHILPKILQNHIAAGEVVERPLSVVKELVENSLDAGATNITVTIKDGGRTYISVRDNGSGMSQEDALLSIQEHATSKISTTQDLFHIYTYGFRGEALSSIASISHFTIETKTSDMPHGWKIHWQGNEKISEEICASNEGTTITVEELFYNTPARRKYLKKDETEQVHIQKYFHEICMAHPDKSFTLLINEKTSLDVRPSSIPERLTSIMGNAFLEHTVPVFCERSDIQIRGYCSKPAHVTSSKRHQHIFINGRNINDHLIAKAAQEAFHRIIVPGTYPEYVLFLTIDPSSLDVNVHPRKLEVRFLEPASIFSIVKGTISTALEKNTLEPTLHAHNEIQKDEVVFKKLSNATFTKEHSHAYTPHSKSTSPYASSLRPVSIDQAALFTEMPPSLSSSPETNKSLRSYTLIGQVQACYIIAESSGGIFLIDQHAAHERILFEKYLKIAESKEFGSQQLLTGEILTLTNEEENLLETYRTEMEELGFHTETFGKGQTVLRSIPAILNTKHAEAKDIFLSILHETVDTTLPLLDKEITTVQEKLLAYAACRAAVKFGDILSTSEQEKLLEDFFSLARRHTCPHGRTSIVEITLKELKKFFDR